MDSPAEYPTLLDDVDLEHLLAAVRRRVKTGVVILDSPVDQDSVIPGVQSPDAAEGGCPHCMMQMTWGCELEVLGLIEVGKAAIVRNHVMGRTSGPESNNDTITG